MSLCAAETAHASPVPQLVKYIPQIPCTLSYISSFSIDMPNHAFPFPSPFSLPFPIFFTFCRSHCLNVAHPPVFQRRLISRHRIRRSVFSFFVSKRRPNRTLIDIDGISSGASLPYVQSPTTSHSVRPTAPSPTWGKIKYSIFVFTPAEHALGILLWG